MIVEPLPMLRKKSEVQGQMDLRLRAIADAVANSAVLSLELRRRGHNASDRAVKEVLWFMSGQLPPEATTGAQFSAVIDQTQSNAREWEPAIRELAVGALHEARLVSPAGQPTA